MSLETLIELPQTFAIKDGRTCTIRMTTEDDAAELCRVLPQMHAESDFLNYFPGEFDKDEEWERKFIREQLAKPAAIMIAAEVDGRIVATGGAGSLENRRFAHHAELGLAILAEFWGQGLGRRIMTILMDWGRAIGLRKMYLKVYADNTRARSLYKSLGFELEARLHGDYLRADTTLGDTLIMSIWFDRGDDQRQP